MVSATHRLEAVRLLASPLTNTTTPAKSTSSFAHELGSAVENHLNQSKSESGQTSGGSQYLVNAKPANSNTVKPISSGPNSTTPSSAALPSNIPTMLGMGPVAGTAPVKQVANAQPLPAAAEVTEGDAYWDAQPAAVQALRNMPDNEAKDQLALKLANQGYSIDTQIMVWGWDPQMTMQIRENQGYAWVPSYGQANIPVGPGLSMPDSPNTYNPGNPPAGAIRVSTAFAIGTIQNPLVQTDSAT